MDENIFASTVEDITMEDNTFENVLGYTAISNFDESIASIEKPGSSFDLELGRQALHKTVSTGNVCFPSKGGKSEQGGTVVCGVCGAVRYYSFVKQAKKFGVYSCESCRKFISKMIHNKGNGELKCNENKGECSVPPYVVNPLGSVRYSHLKGRNARCPACWLKMCLKAFSIPGDLCAALGNRLPDYMQDPAFLTSTIPCKTNTIKKKRKSSFERNIYNYTREEENNDLSEPKIRQKRKAATKFMENIARITGRVTDEEVEHQYPFTERVRKKTTGNHVQNRKSTYESWRVSKKNVKKRQAIKKDKIEDHTIEIKTKTINDKNEEEIKESESPSVQDVIREVGRPRLIILTRNVDFNDDSGEGSIDVNIDSKKEIEEDPFYNWHVIG